MAAGAGGHRPPGLRPVTPDLPGAPGPRSDGPGGRAGGATGGEIPPAAARDAFDDGLAAYLDGDPAAALAAMARAVAIDPSFDEARYLAALVHQDEGRLVEALAELDAVAAGAPADAPRAALRDEALRLRDLVALRLRRRRG